MDKIINGLKNFNKKFPRRELEEAIRVKDEVVPILLDCLDELAKHPEIAVENPDYMLHIYALYLLAQFREKKAFPKIIRLISLSSDEVDYILGDTLTEGLASIMYSTFDGQLLLLESTIENPLINEYARIAALNVYAELYSDGILSKGTLIDYLRKLIYEELHDDDFYIVTSVQSVVINKHIFEMIDDIQFLYDEGRIGTTINGKYDHFIDFIYSYKYDLGSVSRIDDAIAAMEWWACFEQPQNKNRQRKETIQKWSKKST